MWQWGRPGIYNVINKVYETNTVKITALLLILHFLGLRQYHLHMAWFVKPHTVFAFYHDPSQLLGKKKTREKTKENRKKRKKGRKEKKRKATI